MSVGEVAMTAKTNEEKNEEKGVDGHVEKFMKEFHDHGMGCGNKIAALAREMHPDAVAIIPLYRSCIVVEQSDDDKKECVCILHGYADPHWLGRDITIEDLQRKDFHTRFIVRGHREGPGIYLENSDKSPKEGPEKTENFEDLRNKALAT